MILQINVIFPLFNKKFCSEMASLRGLALLLALATASAVRSRFHYDEVSGDGRLRFMPKDVHVKALDDPSQKTYAPGVSEATTPHMHLDEFILQLDGHHDYEGGVLHNPNATSFLETSLWKTRDGGETQSKAKKAVVVAAPIVPHEADNKPAAEEWIQAGATADQRRAFHDQQAHQQTERRQRGEGDGTASERADHDHRVARPVPSASPPPPTTPLGATPSVPFRV